MRCSRASSSAFFLSWITQACAAPPSLVAGFLGVRSLEALRRGLLLLLRLGLRLWLEEALRRLRLLEGLRLRRRVRPRPALRLRLRLPPRARLGERLRLRLCRRLRRGGLRVRRRRRFTGDRERGLCDLLPPLL